MGGGRDLGHVERLHVGGVIEDGRELRGERVELVLGEVQPGEAGDVGHVVAGYAFGHAGQDTAGTAPVAPRFAVGCRAGSGLRCTLVSAHEFLSPEWIEAASRLRDEYHDQVPEIAMTISVNVTVTGTPFADEPVRGHIDTSTGTLLIDQGHLEQSDLTVELGYDLARSLFVSRDYSAAMQALFAGQIKVTGDSSKLLQIQPPDPDAPTHPLVRELAHRIDGITL